MCIQGEMNVKEQKQWRKATLSHLSTP